MVLYTVCPKKGQSNEIFDLHFFHNSNLPGPLTNGLKYSQFCLRIHRVIRIFQSPRGMIPLSPGYDTPPGESIFLGYDTPVSQSLRGTYDTPVSQSPQGIIPRRVNLPGVSYPGKSVFFKA